MRSSRSALYPNPFDSSDKRRNRARCCRQLGLPLTYPLPGMLNKRFNIRKRHELFSANSQTQVRDGCGTGKPEDFRVYVYVLAAALLRCM